MPLSTVEQSELSVAIETNGFAVTPPVVPQLTIDRLVEELTGLASTLQARGGVRNLFETSPAVRELASSPAVRSVAEAVLGPNCFAVRAILFDKTSVANWKVVWHQDVTIAVREQARLAGYGPWSDKAGVPHVQPPPDVLERMLAVRVHLDDCGADNDPVRVLPGSHRVGRLSAAAIDSWRGATPSVDCLAERGAILAFRPLIVHSSSAALSATHRRVVHLEFAVDDLPEPLLWHERVA